MGTSATNFTSIGTLRPKKFGNRCPVQRETSARRSSVSLALPKNCSCAAKCVSGSELALTKFMTEPTRAVHCNLLALIVCLLSAAPPARGATLIGHFDPVPAGTNINLTAEGALDWVHWGLYTESSINRKAGVTPQIPDYIPVK